MAELDGKVALVTGAGRGLGRAHAFALAGEGAALVVNDLGGAIDGSGNDQGPAQEVVAEIIANGGRALVSTHDVADWRAAGDMVDAAYAAFGRLDIVVNNAGVNRFNTLENETADGWRRIMSVNLDGAAAVIHWAAKRWRETGPAPGRVVVNTASPAGTAPAPGAPAYCVSKAAIIALTATCAAELAELGVRVNAIAPMARTRMTDFEALQEIMKPVAEGFDRVAPQHVSQVVLYLASPECRFSGRVFGAEGDDVYLFSGFSATTHVNNGGKAWSIEALNAALADVDLQDRGFMIVPSARIPGANPSDVTLAALDMVAKGVVPPKFTPLAG